MSPTGQLSRSLGFSASGFPHLLPGPGEISPGVVSAGDWSVGAEEAVPVAAAGLRSPGKGVHGYDALRDHVVME